jgi:ATP phosphoribosyltransferase
MNQAQRPIKLAVPKGSIQKTTAAFLVRAGIPLEDYGENSRNYRPKAPIEGVEVKVLRPQEIPILLSRGYYDLGISGMDWYLESRVANNVEHLVDLGFGKVDIVLAVPDAWPDVNSAETLFKKFHASSGKLRIWTEYLNLADEFVYKYEGTEPTVVSPYSGIHRERHAGIEIFQSFGATESKPPEDGEAIIDNTETGRTLRANGLKIIHKVLPASTAQLLANRRSLLDPAKQERIDRIRTAMQKAAQPVVETRRSGFGHMDW